MKIKKVFLILSLFTLFLFYQKVYACSSCGSSATSPLVLYPDENFKMYFGLSQNYNYMRYGYGSNKTLRLINTTIITKDIVTLALGYRTSQNSFVTVTGSYVRNEGPEDINNPAAGTKARYLIGDPLISGRYTLKN